MQPCFPRRHRTFKHRTLNTPHAARQRTIYLHPCPETKASPCFRKNVLVLCRRQAPNKSIMTVSRIVIFGGSPDQLHQVAELIAGAWAMSIFPAGHRLIDADLFPPPGLILFIQEGSFQEAMPLLASVQKKLPHTPVIWIAEKPEREDIIRAFRFGVNDCLLFPLKADEFREALERHGESHAGVGPIKRWRDQFRQWLGIGQAPQDGMGLKKSADGMPGGILFPAARQKQAGHEIEVQFFGSFRFRVKGRQLPLLPGEKVNALLAYLLYYHQKPVHREILLSKFWGYTSPSSARKSLNVAIYTLRQHLNGFIPGMEFLQYYNDNYSINPELDVLTDVDQFLSNWHKGRAAEASHGPQEALEYYKTATALYQGDFLEDMHYEEWCELERDNLKETYLILLDRLGTYFLQEKAFNMAGKVYRIMLEKDGCLENIHRKLILCYYQLGLRDKAIRQYYKCAEVLRKELNIEPSSSTKELFQLIIKEEHLPRII